MKLFTTLLELGPTEREDDDDREIGIAAAAAASTVVWRWGLRMPIRVSLLIIFKC